MTFYDTDKYEFIFQAQKAANDAGYPRFFWNGKIYFTSSMVEVPK